MSDVLKKETEEHKVVPPTGKMAWVCDLIRMHKEMWVKATDGGDMPPTIFVHRGGKVVFVAVAPEINKHKGLALCDLLRRSFAADALTLVNDAHMTDYRGKTKEQIEEIMKKYVGKPGAMQKACDEEGACTIGELLDTLSVFHITEKKEMTMVSLPYKYHGKKAGQPFEWIDELADMLVCTGGDSDIQGMIPDAMKKIMDSPTILQEAGLLELVRLNSVEDADKILAHSMRASRNVMKKLGCLFFDVVEPQDAETREDALKIISDRYAGLGTDGYDFESMGWRDNEEDEGDPWTEVDEGEDEEDGLAGLPPDEELRFVI